MPQEIGDLIFYDLPELAEKFSCHINTLRRYLREGRLKGRKIGSKWFVTADALRDYLYPLDEGDESFDVWPGELVVTSGDGQEEED